MSFKPGVGQNIVLHASPVATIYTILISTLPSSFTSPPQSSNPLSPLSSQWGTVDAENKVPLSETPALLRVLAFKPGAGQNIALLVSPAASNTTIITFYLSSAFNVTSSPPPPFLPPFFALWGTADVELRSPLPRTHWRLSFVPETG